MVCCGSRQSQIGQVLVVNAPSGADTTSVYKSLENQLPINVLTSTLTSFPGVDSDALAGTNAHSLQKTSALAQSAMYLASNGNVPVLELRDASHRHLSEVQKLISKGSTLPLTTVLMYSPIKQLILAANGNLGQLQKSLQDYGHLFRGTYEPTHLSLDHLTRAEFDSLFDKAQRRSTADDKVGLKILKNFLSPLLGLDVQSEVHIEPRFPVYDAVMQLNRFSPSQVAKDLVAHLNVGASTRSLSALHRLEGTNLAHVPVCTHCDAEMRRSATSLMGTPNGRLHSAMPPCASCLRMSRVQLIGSDLLSTEDKPATVDVADILKQLSQAGANVPAVVNGADSQRLTEVLTQMMKPARLVPQDLSGREQLTEEERGKHWHDLLRYNEVFQKCSKNSNARSEALMDQLLYHRIRSLELDVHTQKGSLFWAQAAPAHDWWMSHDTLKGFYETHQHPTLSSVLRNLKAFTRLVPQHEVITLWINVNDDFGGRYPKRGHRPDDLDALLTKHLGAKNIFTPAMLKGTNASIQKGAKAGWPTLSQLQVTPLPSRAHPPRAHTGVPPPPTHNHTRVGRWLVTILSPDCGDCTPWG